MELEQNWTSAICSVLVLIFVWRLLKRIRDQRRYNYPPGPTGLPILGNVLNVQLNKLHLSLFDSKDNYGDVSHYNFAGTRFVVLNSVEAIQEAMKDPMFMVVFSGRPKTVFGQYLLKDGIFQTSYSEKWVKFRQLVHNVIKPYAGGLKEIEMVAIQELDYLKSDLQMMEGKPFDIHAKLSRSVGNIMYILLAGRRYDYEHPIHILQRTADLGVQQMYSPLIDVTLTTFPFLRHCNIGAGKIYQTTVNSLRTVIQYFYKNYNPEKDTGVLIDLLSKQAEHEWLTDDKVDRILRDIVVAGVTSTTATMYCMLFILLHRQDVQKRLQDEVDDAVGRENNPSLDDIPKMPYTQAVILETMRFAPFVPFAPHSALEDVTFRGFHIKKDTIIACNTWRVHHDADLWEEPWSFKPERYLDHDGTLLPPEHPNRRHILLFGLGKRRCMGEVLAKTRMFLFLSHLCQRFTMYVDNPADLPSMDPRDYATEFLVTPGPYLMRVSLRE